MKTKSALLLALAILAAPLRATANPLKLPLPPELRFSPPKGNRQVLPNGMVVYLMEDHAVPLVQIAAYIRAGDSYDPPDKTGLATLTASSMRAGGSAKYKADDINAALEGAGARVESSMLLENGSMELFSLSSDLDKALDIFADILVNPAFEPAKVELERKKYLEAIKRRNDQPQQIASRETVRRFYGPDHPYGRRAEIATLNSITIEDMRAYHKRFYRPNAVMLAIAGDFDTAKMLETLRARFGAWQQSPLELPQLTAPSTPKTRQVYLVDKELKNAPIMIIQPAPKRHAAEQYDLEVANEVLGGGNMGGRLFSEVRTRKGLAYSVSSRLAKNDKTGYWRVYCGTKNSSVTQAITEILSQLGRLKAEPVGGQELGRAKDGLINSYIFTFTTPLDIAYERMTSEYFGYDSGYVDEYPDRIAHVTPASAFAAARKWLNPANAMIFVVGTKKEFGQPLSVFGPVEEVPQD